MNIWNHIYVQIICIRKEYLILSVWKNSLETTQYM